MKQILEPHKYQQNKVAALSEAKQMNKEIPKISAKQKLIRT
jgi:hypothetical protein